MNITVDKNAIGRLYSDKLFVSEMKAFLNSVIDEEIEKADEMDTELIDECIDLLSKLDEDDNRAVIIPFAGYDKILKLCHRNKFNNMSRAMRASLIACIILLSALTANTVIAKVFDYNVAQEVVNSISEKLHEWGLIASAEDDNETVVEEVPSTTAKKTEEEATTQPIKESEKTSKQNTPQPVTAKSNSINDKQESTTKADVTLPIELPAEEIVKHTYSMVFDANGGKCNINSIEVTYGKPVGKLPVPEKDGYDFIGWYNKDISYKRQDGRKYETPLSDNTIYNQEKDAVVTAKWVYVQTISFDADGGKCAVTALKVSSMRPSVDLPIPVKDGYYFVGWYDKFNSRIYKTSDQWRQYNAFGDGTLIALWIDENEVLTVNFDANGGKCDVKSKDFIYGRPYGDLPVPTREGWNFLGWCAYNENFDTIHITNDTVLELENYYETLYALWYKTKATVTFDCDGGICNIKSKTIYSHNSYGELPVPEKNGFIFEGWYNGNNKINDYTGVGDTALNHTLKAKWKPVNVKIYFNANGGVLSSTNEKIDYLEYGYTQAFGELPMAAKPNYRFDGWYTEADGGVKLEANDKVESLDSVMYYAHWVRDENICFITLYTNNAKDDTVLTRNKGDRLDAPDLKSSGLTKFLGWYTEKEYGEKVENDFIVNEDMNLYAHYGLATNIIKTVKLEKTEYELNEKIDISSASIVLISGGAITSDMLKQYDARMEYDTSTYGTHSLKITVSMDGLILEGSTNIFVKGCTHNAGTYITNVVEPTCINKGYSGDIACSGCNEILEKGRETAAVGHNENTVTRIVNAKEPTCVEKGYTGDTVCTVCNKVLKKGKAIAAVPHSDTEEVISKASFTANGKIEHKCKVCGNIASTTTLYSPVVTLSKTVFTYDGTVKTPEISVKEKNGNLISDYTLTLDEGRTEIGKYNAHISIDSEYYQGETTVSFFIVNELQNPQLKITTTSNSILVNWNAVEGAAGYQVKYEKPGSGSGGTTIAFGNNNTKAEFKGVSKGQYLVKIRTYQRINGSDVYTDWSVGQPVTVR